MRIGIVASLYFPYEVGGAEKSTRELAEGLVKQGNQVFLLTHVVNNDREQEIINGVRVTRMKPSNLYSPYFRPKSIITKAIWHSLDSNNPFTSLKIKRWINDNKLDVVNTHNISGFSPSIWKTISRMEIPLVHTIHDMYALCPRTTMSKSGKICESQCLECTMFSAPGKRASNYVDGLVGVSEFILTRHKHFNIFPNAIVKLIHNGIHEDYILPITERDQRKTKNGITFGFMGRIEEEKGIHWLIDSYLKFDNREIELRIAGRGVPEIVKQLKERTAGRPDIVWLGYVDPSIYFKEIDVLIVPSLWNDISPRVINEAFINEVPVIGSLRGGIPEFVKEDVGWLVDPDIREDLVFAIDNVIRNKRHLPAMGKKARKRAELLTMDRTINQYMRFYQELVQS